MSTPMYVEAPDNTPVGRAPSVFLAGGITNCPDWQSTATNALLGAGITVFNPRRVNFPIHDPSAASEQIIWEYHHLHAAEVTMFWFPASRTSVQPIALYELGMALGQGRTITVGVDPNYARATDVRIQTSLAKPGLTVHASLDTTIQATITTLCT